MRSLPAVVALGLVWGLSNSVGAQSALAAARPDSSRLPAAPRLTLRPEPGLLELADQVAAVLELRSGARVEVGDPPPPGLPEAVPAGHVALVREPGRIVLVIGVAGGQSVGANVPLVADGSLPDTRSLALAVESLEDAASERLRESERLIASAEPTTHEEAVDGEAGGEAAPAESFEVPGQTRRDHGSRESASGDEASDGIQPLVQARSYMGVTPATTGAVLTLATGVGVCAIGYCLVIQGEFPVNGENTSAVDVRYRYMTFGTGLHAQPLRFGRFIPAANLLLITRLGHFERDMGMSADTSTGLDTDLAARASLELGVELFKRFDALVESGVDLTIDGWQVSGAGTTVERGERAVPWLQAGVRYRPY